MLYMFVLWIEYIKITTKISFICIQIDIIL